MKTKLIALALSLLLVVSFAPVSMASASSVTVDSLTNVVNTTPVSEGTSRLYSLPEGELPLAGFTISIVPDTQNVLDEVEKIQKFLEENPDATIVDYFGEVVKGDVQALVPDGFDVATLEMFELVTAQATNYSPDITDTWALVQFATPYREGQVVVPVVGVYDDLGNVEWFALEAETAVVDGRVYVQITFPKDLLDKLQSNPFALAMLSEP